VLARNDANRFKLVSAHRVDSIIIERDAAGHPHRFSSENKRPGLHMDIYESQAEQEQHEQAVEALAEELQRDVHEVQQAYERAYIALKSDATVKDYLPLFVARRTRAMLRAQRRM
jgi:hypothetical protein